MTREISIDQWREQRRCNSTQGQAQFAQRLSEARRRGSSRVRTAEEQAVLTRHVIAELERREREGHIVYVGPRHYELHPRQNCSAE